MEVLNEYIASVPVTNLWHLWAIVVISMLICVVNEFVSPKILSGCSFCVFGISLGVAICLTAAQDANLERQGYIIDPPAFVEMLNDWELVDQQGTLFTVREREPMTKDEIKEWKNGK